MGVSINVLNQSLKRIAVVDDYTSLIWAKRYNDIGAVDLQIEATTENLQLFKKYNYITRDDDDAVYRIEAVELDTSVEEANYLIVGGYDCKKILNQRIVWNQLNFKGTVENFIRKIITDNIIDPVNSQRRINNFLLKPARGFAEEIEAQTTYDNVGEKVIELCAANNYGWSITLEGGAWYFDLYKGVNRSIDQSENPRVVFAPQYDNLSSTKYTMDSSEYRNVALVAGEGEGVQRKTRTLGNAAGINRFEMFVDSNVSSNSEGDLVDYYEALIADGKEQLAEQAVTTTFEGEIDSQSYKYKKDYNLGDIVTVMNEYSIKVNARIVEVAETWDEEGYTIDPIFEYMEVGEENFDGAILTEDHAPIATEGGEVLLQEEAESTEFTSSRKISELPSTMKVRGTELVPVVQMGVTKAMPVSALKGEKGDKGDQGETGYSEPVGSVMGYPGKTEPEGWLFVQGQTLSRTEYARLLDFAIENDLMGTMFGEGDGETTFTLPDWREVVIVGAGQNGLLPIADHDVYTLGQFKDDQLQNITGSWNTDDFADEGSGAIYRYSGTSHSQKQGAGTATQMYGLDASRVARTGTTTHGKQVGLNYIIKY